MSVLINMEMPANGNETIIRIQPDGTILDQYGHHLAITAVPVPPHGRLIDADALEDFIRKDWDKNDHWIAEVIYSRPTIIPAELPKDEAQAGPYDLLYEEGGPDA